MAKDTLTPDSSDRGAPIGTPSEEDRARLPIGVRTVQFESGEHRFVGDAVNLYFPEGAVSAGQRKLFVGAQMGGNDPKHLTYGQVVALGGDFYGVVGHPISTSSDTVAAFGRAYGSLSSAASAEVNQILTIMDEEIAALNAARAAGKPPSSAYAKLGDALSYKWNMATGGLWGTDPNGRYLALASENWDHFAEGAIACYCAGHTAAMTYAAAIKSSNRTSPEKVAALEHAYAMNAFADHFLTDLFSAGHLRTPRKALTEQVLAPYVGSLLARCMHDEDSKYGLTVHNARGDQWIAYGDKRLLDNDDAANITRVKTAVQYSVGEVWNAYRDEKVSTDMLALTFAPDLARTRTTSTHENFSPLFVLIDGIVHCRNTTSRSDYSWTPKWSGPETLAWLKWNSCC